MKSKKIVLTTLSPKTHRTSEENLGLGYLAAILRQKGYDVEIIDAWLGNMSVDEVFQKIIQIDNLLFVGISSYMSNTLPTIELCSKLKNYNKDIKLVSGGFGPTFYAEDYLNNNVDIVVRGEGEEIISELADALYSDQDITEIEGISYLNEEGKAIHNRSKCLINNLDDLPFPTRDTIDIVMDRKSTVNVLTARGCSGNCEFCSVISFFRLSNGKVWRSRSIENIVDEIEQLYNQGVKYIKMVDDSFVDGYRDEEWCKAFADEIKRRGIKVNMRGQIRADKINDNVLKYLKEAGFYSFACGIENGSSKALERMHKKASLIENRKALELFKKYNYIVQMGYILFDKETTMDELEENYEFMKEYDWAVTKGIFSEMYSAEGTSLTNKLRNNGELIESDFLNNNNKYKISDPNVSVVYEGLKKWHKSHSMTYDMTIDPISSPKALPYENILSFYQIAMALKQKDLQIFRMVLDLTYQNLNIVEYVDQQIEDNRNFYDDIDNKVKVLYKKNNITYNADANPFI